MNANTKKAVDGSSRAATLASETDGASGSERTKLVVEQRPHPRLPSTLEGSSALSYADIGFFFVFAFFLAMMFRIGVHLHVLRQARPNNPTLPFQITTSLFLIGMIHLWNLILIDVLLGPVIEESFFRGCLLPVVARTTGPTVGIATTAALFATLHPINTLVQWLCFLVTGIAFGWMRAKSGSTAASTLMHAIYNATLFLCQVL